MKLDLANTAWLGAGDWQAKVAEARRKRHEKASYGRKPDAPPVAMMDKKDADAARLKAAKERRTQKLYQATETHRELRKFLTILKEQEATFGAPRPGVLDVDIVELALHFRVDALPADIRFLAVEEVHALISRVNKRVHGSKDDDIPFGLPRGVTLTLEDFKLAMRMF